MSLYKKQEGEELSGELFQNPSSEYRGEPFWAWNNRLETEQLLRQIGYFQEMGMGGFHIHCRAGLDTPYMGEEYKSIVRACCDKAKRDGLLCWLYDEDRWPSGSAGGMVTKDSAYCQRRMIFTAFEHPSEEFVKGGSLTHGILYHVAEYAVSVQDGILQAYERVAPGEMISPSARRWYAYLTIAPRGDSFNGESYVDTLNKRAIEKFIELTHEQYYRTLGDEFGRTAPAIFTDEPQFASKQTLARCDEAQEIQIPFTDDLEEAYQESYGESLLDRLPELFWELPEGRVSVTRYRYHDFVAERFAESFADTLGTWCERHGIMLTGHMMAEDTLASQTSVLGDAMRSYRSFQLPGIDVLMDRREFATAKQAQSASHQYGREGVLSELYGVTNWDFDFRGHKLQGDWQAALGVTTRVPHLTWVSMKGEAKRDYPASIGYHSPWYRQYSMMEDHFARLNTALTRGRARVRVGVIHPVESMWLYYGSNEKTGAIRDELQTNFQNLLGWMLFGLIDFDYICESLLPSLCSVKEEASLQVGQMQYDAVVVPGCVTLRSTTLESLEAFARGGGQVLFVGEPAPYTDARPSDRAAALAAGCRTVPFSRKRVLEALAPYRELDIISVNGVSSEWGGRGAGARTERLLYQMREDGEDRWLFIAHGLPMINPDLPYQERIEIQVAGEWQPTSYDTMSGAITPVQARYQGGKTLISHAFYEHDSLLLLLRPGRQEDLPSCETRNRDAETIEFPDVLPVTMSAPNVLLLDMAEFKIDRGPWRPREEILRIDEAVRAALHIKRSGVQPWTIGETAIARHMVRLRYTIECRRPARDLALALENQESTRLLLDDREIRKTVQGYFTDEAIETVALPDLEVGTHYLELEMPYSEKTCLEACYLIGDFGVRVSGSQATLVEPVRQLEFGSWTEQGLPFYGQNVTYHIPVKLERPGTLEIRATKFRCPLWKVYLDGEEQAAVALAPYTATIPGVAAGRHEVAVEVFGNQINTFGCVHNCNEQLQWFGGGAWKTKGDGWAYEYQLKRCGILKKPEIRLLQIDD